ncbi:sensor histidine kinase [Mongoliibacter sp.]|uniref:sensor histidine kinase n=1 Tax=Mongoliibacter sp. TaxID=2022438 RepID=UPI0025D7517E|nr:sensor histidine kinase [Mongoliibacter sp.]
MSADINTFGSHPEIRLRIKTAKLIAFCFLACLLACQDIIDHENKDSFDKLTETSTPNIIFLDSLSVPSQPQKMWLNENLPPISIPIPQNNLETFTYQDGEGETRIISPPRVLQRPFLKNEKGKAILDDKGNKFFMGDGGLSHFTTFTTDEGLALDNITSSIVDSSGNIWFGTWGGGISKYDGISFTNFTTAHGLSNNLVHCLAEDTYGNIWIGTEGGGISIYDGFSFIQKTTSDGLIHDIVYGITPDSKGNVWIAAGSGGASKYDGDRFINFDKGDGLPESSIIKIAEDDNGYIWFGTGSKGVVRYDGNDFLSFTEVDGLAENSIHSITKDRNGNLWFGTIGGGIFRYEENNTLSEKGSFKNFTTTDGLGHPEIWDIKEDLEGNLWFATGGNGVSKYDGKKFTNYSAAQGLPENVVYSISIDKSGNIWFGTAGGGVTLYNGTDFYNFTSEYGFIKNRVYSIIEDNNGDLWFCTDGGGVTKYNGESFTYFTTEQGLPHPLVISASKDKNGHLWFGTGGGGLALYKEKNKNNTKSNFTSFSTKNGLPNNVIYAIEEGKDGTLWLGTGGAGLVKFDWNTVPEEQAGFTAFTTEQGLAFDYVYSILEDSKGNLWIGTGGGGISKFDGKSFKNYNTADGLSNDIVWSIIEDRVGNLWFATQGGGVSRFDGKSFSSFTKREGLVDDTVYDLLEDGDGNIFIGTNKGFTVIPASVASLPFNQMAGSLEHYNTSNGYPVKDINKGILLDSQGYIWAGNGSDKTGLVKLNYQALRKKKTKPSVKIKSISIYEKPISWVSLEQSRLGEKTSKDSSFPAYITDEVRLFERELSIEERTSQAEEFSKIQFSNIRRFENFPEKLTLPYSQNQITIDFGTNELARPNLMEYRYILEGYSKTWSPPVVNNRAVFGNIWEGEYKFKVMSRYTGPAEGEGKEWSEAATFTFSVLPPWYRTWWAYLIYFSILLIIIKRVHLIQKTKTIRKERERIQQKELEQAKEIEKAYAELKSTQAQLIQSEKMASLGELTSGIAHEIKNPLNFVNNFSEVSAEMISEIKEERAKNQDERDETLVSEILEDIEKNLEKIQHHGKRADLIVKAMLEHSKSGSGAVELTDLNTLIKEYLNIGYQGFKIKNKEVKIDLKTNFDNSIPKMKLVRSDIGKVLLNIVNNAFYACAERSRGAVGAVHALSLPPTVHLTTRNLGDKIEISISDNGSGIPDTIKDKIFQPFFTTKPTGQGTGLGLSLSYDIVKAHGGEIKVESLPTGEASLSAEGHGTKMTIILPVKD